MSTTAPLLQQFRDRMGEVIDLRAAGAVLSWDQQTYMPKKGAEARGRQLATLSALGHRLFTAGEIGDLLSRLEEHRAALSPDERKMVEETRYHYDRARKLPEVFVKQCAETEAAAFEAWVEAKRDSNFAHFRPHLEKIVSLSKRRAEYLGYQGSPYNALLGAYERGQTAEALKPLFADLAERQSALVRRLLDAPKQPDTGWLAGEWDVQKQWDFSLRLLRDIGYDLDAGRQDKSPHPFSTNFDLYDVRVTTRVHPEMLFSGFMASLHEGGHALYEQGFRPEDQRTPLAEPISLGIHESQSRMWENMIGRSRPFWERYLPILRDEYFPRQLAGVDLDRFLPALNEVRPSFIRVEADEVTYNLHVILRFEIEVALVEGSLAAADIPAAWNAKMKQYLGLDVPDDAHGCLQDVHWSFGSIGYFPTYTLGNLYGGQMLEVIERDLPNLWEQVRAGQFAPLLEWLREHVHRVGSRRTAPELIQDISGRALEAGPYLRYLTGKYEEIYGL